MADKPEDRSVAQLAIVLMLVVVAVYVFYGKPMGTDASGLIQAPGGLHYEGIVDLKKAKTCEGKLYRLPGTWCLKRNGQVNAKLGCWKNQWQYAPEAPLPSKDQLPPCPEDRYSQ